MQITKDTVCCISIAERPSNFGSTVFNTSFEALALDFIYKPFKVTAEDLPTAIKGLRAFGIRGCGVSMPHKTAVIKYLDRIDPVAEKIGAVNTIVNEAGILSGYSTDFIGAKTVLEEGYDVSGKKVVVIGAGGVSRAIIVALKELGAGEINISSRDEKRGRAVADQFDLDYFSYDQKDNQAGDLLVNATPVGMVPDIDGTIVAKESFKNYQAVMDVVQNPYETSLARGFKDLGKIVIPGYKMAIQQAAAQFKLYTNQAPPIELMVDSVRKLFGGAQ